MPSTKELKKIACEAIDAAATDLNTLGQFIWQHPELAYEEYQSHDYLTQFLERRDFQVERKFHLDTAFRATCGEVEKPNMAILCEYDCLPVIKHGCGHNLIAEVGVATALGIKAAMEAADKPIGKLTVLGTPAEEDGGGKIDLIQKGAFKGIDAAIMAHPGCNEESRPTALAVQEVYVTFHGKASHAAAFPWEGINALDAAVMAYSSTSSMRQQMKPTWRMHGIINNGGAKPNIIPEEAEIMYYLRTPTEAELHQLKEIFQKCCDGAALATGCTVTYNWMPKPYIDLISNDTLSCFYESNTEELGINIVEEVNSMGSTDMGNVSHVVPGIHPVFHIGTDASEHTREFCTQAGSSAAQGPTLRTAKALAMTALDVMCTEGAVSKMWKEFEKDTE